MTAYQDVFQRVEKKYLLDSGQYHHLMRRLKPSVIPDRFPRSTIGNVYYDTPARSLIRTSLEKPVYKEKLRLRSYEIPAADTTVFLEIKKKFKGVVYKRREGLPYERAKKWLTGQAPPYEDGSSQIAREIDWFLHRYGELEPAMFLSYERLAFQGKENPALRVTFDENILWREHQPELDKGLWGAPLLPPGSTLMEIKIPGAMPLWLARELDTLRIYPCSYSKYGSAYQLALLRKGREDKGGIVCA